VAYTRIRVVGPSMEPTVRNGQWWLVRRTSDVRPGHVVLLRHPVRTDLLLVKRIIRAEGTGWWVEGDNPSASDDSREFGPIPAELVKGRLVWRYHPLFLRG
jgi:nickel-type superoxide dismutase maturation protease